MRFFKAFLLVLPVLALAAPLEMRSSEDEIVYLPKGFSVVDGKVLVGPGGYMIDGKFYEGEYHGSNNEKRLFGLTLGLLKGITGAVVGSFKGLGEGLVSGLGGGGSAGGSAGGSSGGSTSSGGNGWPIYVGGGGITWPGGQWGQGGYNPCGGGCGTGSSGSYWG